MILVAYASKHGATAAIACRIATRLSIRGDLAEASAVDDVDGLDEVTAVVLGSAVYAGSWRREAVAFAERYATTLARIPVWLFSSGPLGERVDARDRPRQVDDLRRWIAPREHRTFAGALDLRGLSFGERVIVRAVDAPAGDFRDWGEIDAWADEIGICLHADRTAGLRLAAS